MQHLTDIELIDLAGRQVPADQQRHLQDHLADCLECRRRHEEIAQTRQVLDGWHVEVPKTDLWVGLQARLQVEQPSQVRRIRVALLRTGRIAAAVLLGIGVGHAIGRWSLPKPTAPAVQLASPEPAVDDETVARWLYLTSLDTRTPAGMADAVLRIAGQLQEEATQ